MRTPSEIRAALALCRMQMADAAEKGDHETADAYADIGNALQWVLGESGADFAALLVPQGSMQLPSLSAGVN